jgi:hypothetical protein
MQEQEKINDNGDLRCFADELIRGRMAVTPAKRDVDINFMPQGQFDE